jgi:Mn-containing catalase
MSREITHMKAFAAALDSLGKPRFSVGKIAPSKPLVDQYFNDSTGEGDMGEIDTKGPWNEGDTWQVVDARAFAEARGMTGDGQIESEASEAADPEGIRELLVEQMRDLLHAEKQLVRRCPRWQKPRSMRSCRD